MIISYDIILENGRVFAYDGYYGAVAIDSGKIAKVGDRIDEYAKKRIDLEGKYVIPSFIDAHVHMIMIGLQKERIDLSKATSRDEAISTVRDAAKRPWPVVVGYGWDESMWKDKNFLTSDDFEGIDKPVVLFRKDLHMATVNSKAMRTAGIESRDGIVREEDTGKLKPLVDPGPEERKIAMDMAFDEAISKGVCAVRDVVDMDTSIYYRENNPPVYVDEMIYSSSFFSDYGRTGNERAVKAFLDGSIGSMTAAHDGWDEKNLKMNKNEFQSFSSNFWNLGFPVAVHAIGDIATETASAVFSKYSGKLRNSIEHFEFVNDSVLEEMNRNVVISSQPNFLQWSFPGGLYEDRLGTHWLRNNNRFRTYLDTGLKLAFGSDSMPFGPEYGIYYAINAPFENQRISLEQAIRAYTEGSAYALGLEDSIGRIEKGFVANLNIFNVNYPEDQAKNMFTEPESVILSGKFIKNGSGGKNRN